VIGVAIRRSGLGERLAHALAARMGTTYPAIVVGCVLMASGLAFLMPSSMGRVVILTPIVLALADRFGFAPGSRGRAGMALAACLGTVMTGSGILPANVPNMVLIGASEMLYAFVPEYGAYFLLHFPVTAALKGVALVACICLLLPDRPRPAGRNDESVAGDGSARRLTIILAFALAFWATDFIHHVSPAWIALGAALMCFLPRVGMVPASAFNGELNYSSLFYVAAILGLGTMIADSGLGDLLTGVLVEAIGFAPGQPFRSFMAMSLLTTVVGMVTTIPGVPAIMTPLGAGIADATGMPLETVLMTQVIGYSTILLPYQTPPIIVGIQLADVTIRDAGRVMVALGAATVVVLLPLNYLWWSFLGMFA
jgi:di/tricarboxylate transporter